MIIKDRTLVAFKNGDLGIVIGVPRTEYQYDERAEPISSTDICDVKIVFPCNTDETRPDVDVEELNPLGQTKEVRTKNSIGQKTIENMIKLAENLRMRALDPVI